MTAVLLILFTECAFAYFLLLRSGYLRNLSSRVICAAVLLAAFAFRFSVMDYETQDYQFFLSKWVEFFRISGGFEALKYPVGNYNIPYLYFLAFFSYSSIRDLYLIKLLSIFFDVVLAFASMKLCGKMIDNSSGTPSSRPLFCFFTVLFLPTVFLNGALWGQCDSIYVSLALLGIWLALEDRPVLSVVCAALSFGFKLQAVFILPIYAVLLFKGKFKLWHVLVFPLTYIILVLPAVIAGRPFLETLALYSSQTGTIGDGLNYNSPSLFAVFDGYGGFPIIENTDLAAKLGIATAFVYMGVLLLTAFLRRKELGKKQIMLFAALLALGIPLFLPHMHDRYFFAADILFLITAFGAPETAICAPAVQFASLLGYHAYLKLRYLLMMRYGAYALLAVLLYTGVCLAASLRAKGEPNSIDSQGYFSR